MSGRTTVLWLHAERCLLGKARDWMSWVRNICVKTETYYGFFHPLIFLFCLLYDALYVFAVKQDEAVPVLVKTVVAALVVSVIFNVIFCGTLCKIVQRKKCPSKGNYCLS